MHNEDAEIIEAESVSHGTALAAIPGGGITQQLQTQYVTAMQVQAPRNLKVVTKRFLEESRMMGEAAYYGWGSKPNRIEGPSQAIAYAAARCWGNCAVDQLSLEDTKDAWIFTSVFIDCETGFTLTRKFRQSKRWTVHGKHDAERKDDIRFQIGQTKGDRNVILKALPKWFIDRGVEEAKAGVRKRLEGYIEKKGLPAAIDYATKELAKSGVTEERVCQKFGVAKSIALTLDNLIIIAGDIKAIQQGQEYPSALYPVDDAKELSDKIATSAKRKAKPKDTQPPAPPEQQPGPTVDQRSVDCRIEYLDQIAQTTSDTELDNLLNTACRSGLIQPGDIEILHREVEKKKKWLVRGERSSKEVPSG